MCGIAGIISKERKGLNFADNELFSEMLVCDSIRGPDSTGVFGVTHAGNAEFLKIGAQPFNLINSKAYKEWKETMWGKGQFLVGHNRKATLGAVNNENAHPFVFGNTLLVHNGFVENFRSLLPIRERDKHKIEVDSHAACLLLARNEPEKILKEMRGAFAFVWYNVLNKTLQFVRNEERPLYFAAGDTKVYFASEGGMLHWLLGRRGIKTTISALKPGVLLTFKLDTDNKLDWEYKSIELAGPKIVVPLPPREQQIQQPQNRALRNMFQPYKQGKMEDDIEIPEGKQFNIHYGNDFDVFEEAFDAYQQIIWTVEDFKPVDPQRPIHEKQKYRFWGNAIDSERIYVETILETDEKGAEGLAYAPNLIGLIRSIQIKRYDGDPLPHFALTVSNTLPVELVGDKNGEYVTLAHQEHLHKGRCDCNQLCGNFPKSDMLFHITGNKIDVVCDWCEQWKKEEREAIENPAV